MINMKKNFDLLKYGMMFCPICNGDGDVPGDGGGFKVCTNCGGFGLVKDAEGGPPGKQIKFRDKHFLLPE